jgi:hypothetical protein
MADSNGKIQVADKFKHLNPLHNLSDSIKAGNFHRILIKGKVWKLSTGGQTYQFVQDNGYPLPYLDIVIVGINPATSKLYYPANTYQEDSTNAPTCASTDGIVPDNGVPIKQHDTCNGCPRDQWKPNRGGKDCQDHKRTAILLLPWMKTKPVMEKPLTEPVFFKVPPASLKVWKAYTDSLQSRGAHYASVITRVSFEPDKQFQMKFEYLQPLTNDDSDLVLPLLDDMQTKNLIGGMPEFKQVAPSIDAPRATGLAQAFGKKAVEPEVEETPNLPAKRGRGRPPKEVKPAEEVEETPNLPEGEWQEPQDDDLNSMMNEVLGPKLGKMMPDKH